MERRSIHHSAILTGLGLAGSVLLGLPSRATGEPERPGDKMVQALRANTVAIRAEWEEDDHRSDGFGFIVGVKGETTFVATANHVVRGYEGDRLADKVTVRFFGSRKTVEAKVLPQHDVARDVAVIRVTGLPQRPWFRSASGAYATAERGTQVWFIGRSGTWYTPARPGTVNYLDPDLGLVLEGLSVIVGTSGAPLISAEGIVGLMTTDAAGDLSRACPIRDVRKLLRSWKVPWQLVPPNLELVPPGIEVSPAATSDAARLAMRLGNFERAGAAAKRAFAANPNDAEAAELLVTAAARGPWRLCVLVEPNTCRVDNPYLELAPKALKTIRTQAPDRAQSEAVLGAEIRILRMMGETKSAAQKAKDGLRRFPDSAWFLAEAGVAQARNGDKQGVTLIARAEQEDPDEFLYWLYGAFAMIDAKMLIEAGRRIPTPMEAQPYYQRHPALFTKLTPLLGSRLPKRLWAALIELIPVVEADRKGAALPYDDLAAVMEKHKMMGGYDASVDRIRLMVDLRRGKTAEALARSSEFMRKFGGLQMSLRAARDPLNPKHEEARGGLRAYHELLVATQARPEERYAIERYGNLGLPFSTPHHPRAEEPLVLRDGPGGQTTAVALTDPPTLIYSASGDGVHRWRLPDLTREGFVLSDEPVCGLAASKNGDVVAFVTETGRGYLWTLSGRGQVEPLVGGRKLSCRVAISADGRQLAAVQSDQQVLGWTTDAVGRKPSVGPRLPWAPEDAQFVGTDEVVFTPASAKNAFAAVRLGGTKVRAFRCGDGDDAVGTTVDRTSARVAVATETKLRVCSAATGELVDEFDVKSKRPAQIDLFSSGQKVVLRTLSRRPEVYTVGGKYRRARYHYGTGSVTDLAISEDGRTAVGWDRRDGELTMLYQVNPDRNRWERTRRPPSKDRWGRVAIEPTRRRMVVTWQADRGVPGGFVYEFAKRKHTCGFRRADERRFPLFNQFGGLVEIVRNDRRSTSLYDETCKRVGFFSDLSVSPSGKWLAIREDRSIEVRTVVEDKSKTRRFDCQLGSLTARGFSPDERWFVGADDETICFVDLRSGEITRDRFQVRMDGTQRSNGRPRDLAFAPDGSAVAVVDRIGVVNRWTLPGKTRKNEWGPTYWEYQQPSTLPRIVYATDGAALFTLSGEGDLMKWSTIPLTLQRTAVAAGKPFELSIADDGQTLFVHDFVNKDNLAVHAVKPTDLSTVATIRAFAYDRWLAYRPDGTCSASSGTAAAVIPAFAVRSGKVIRTGRECDESSVLAAFAR